ncbi:MAG TPA: hypothetical protein VNB94_07900 [Mycobacteriales bacterium]|nr:hypothetical protein [Mycobacteriales bacterium]
MADVRLTDLEVIQRYSIAVRGETADRSDLVAALRSDLTWLEGGARTRRAAASTSEVGVALADDLDDDQDDDLDDFLDSGRSARAPAGGRAPKPTARRASSKPAPRRSAAGKPTADKTSTPKPAARRAAAPKSPAPKPAARRSATPKPATRKGTAKPTGRTASRAAAPAPRTAKKTTKPAARRGR